MDVIDKEHASEGIRPRFKPRWRRDGKEILFDSADGKMMAVEVKLNPSFQAGVPRELFKIPGAIVNNRFAIAGDAPRFLLPLTPQSSDRPTITTVLNWTADIKK